ncbi:EthD family reductase [Sinimarinibacterium sp. CAU 1509]|uniref:EthD domain-containing protein n=1 Tax=Sinimarinibacterium sp. CAU 1509 TaxID=2562283 RepID=UPI0010AD05DD|nr:EthD domain-containing protein [Sinimarinibacterium sp. CAU 1509]TJY63097.1 EthD family reductase [Sinimarinibacterium sp. CAU 1509]
MIKLIVAIHRRPDMSPEAFHTHWRTQHAALVKNNPATQKYVRKYVQCHTTAESYAQGEAAFDGTAELWFDSAADRDAFFSDPDYLTHIQPDESRFADMTRTVFFVTEEEAVFECAVV